MARRQFGNRLRLREQSRDVKLLPWLDSLVRDVRLGARMLRKNGLVTAAAIVSLSLALGACMAAFSLVDALILRPLPVHQPERLIYLTFPGTNPDLPEDDVFSDPAFVRLRDAGRGRVDLFAMAYPNRPRVTFDVASGDRETVRAQFVSGDAFERLGVGPAAGRLLTMQDDRRPGAHPVAVLSHAFWMQRFGGDPGIVGRWFVVHGPKEDRQFQIIGVTEPRFSGVEPGYSTDVWLPYAMQDPSAFGNSGYRALRVIGRVKEDVAVEQVHGVLQAAFTNFRREDAADNLGPNTPPDRVAHFINTPLHVRPAATGLSPLRARFQRPLWVLTAIAALMLLIAGSNVANLFLARTAAREDEMSLRLSLGAGRGRLIQQMLIESAIVAGAACLIGVMFAAVAAPAVVSMLRSADDPVLLDLRVDWRLVAFISGMTLLSSALLGLAAGVARVERRADDRPEGERRACFRPRAGHASVRRHAGGVQPDRPLRGRPAGPVLRQAVQRESWIRHVGRVARVLGSRTAHRAESTARGAAAGARSASRSPRCRRRQRGRVQRARPDLAERHPRARHARARRSK